MMTSGADPQLVGSAPIGFITIGIAVFIFLTLEGGRSVKRMKRNELILVEIEDSRVLQEIRDIDGIQVNMERKFNETWVY